MRFYPNFPHLLSDFGGIWYNRSAYTAVKNLWDFVQIGAGKDAFCLGSKWNPIYVCTTKPTIFWKQRTPCVPRHGRGDLQACINTITYSQSYLSKCYPVTDPKNDLSGFPVASCSPTQITALQSGHHCAGIKCLKISISKRLQFGAFSLNSAGLKHEQIRLGCHSDILQFALKISNHSNNI
jgi:hypothetical protein